MKTLDCLARMIDRMNAIAADLPADLVRTRASDGSFAFLEHVWHLADLEREGFGLRIARLLAEDQPALHGFDGAAVAAERDYLKLDLAQGLTRFIEARRENLDRLAALTDAQRARGGTFMGDPILVADMPRRMLEHDRAHLAELAALLAEIAPQHPALPELRAAADGGASAAA
jgi:hypothetical protein